ncbi:MAG: nuclear transport factor 2 family protein [Gammaproteobacteria bacterium]|nr:nuclear transport factor 2 family protein [Gammaproteobacteria bacterium]
MSTNQLSSARMEAVMREYYDGCNEADREKITGCFTPDAVHYFPPGMYEGPFRGAAKIAGRWCAAVEKGGSYWTIDALLIDADKAEAVIEWSHFKTGQGTVLRGAEWVVFDRASGLMQEIRAYYASPQAADLKRLELGGFDYEGRGYEMDSPRGRSAGQ